MHNARIRADMEAAALQHGGELRNVRMAGECPEAAIVHESEELPEPVLFAFRGRGGHEKVLFRTRLPDDAHELSVMAERPFLQRICRIDREMHGARRNRQGRCGGSGLIHAQLEARRRQGKSERGERLIVSFPDGDARVASFHPVAYEPSAPKMHTMGRISRTPACSNEGGEKSRAIRAAKVEGHIKCLMPQSPDHGPLLAKFAPARMNFQGPHPVHTGTQAKNL